MKPYKYLIGGIILSLISAGLVYASTETNYHEDSFTQFYERVYDIPALTTQTISINPFTEGLERSKYVYRFNLIQSDSSVSVTNNFIDRDDGNMTFIVRNSATSEKQIRMRILIEGFDL